MRLTPRLAALPIDVFLRVVADTKGSHGDWRAAAMCRQTDPDAWFPPQGETTLPARRICVTSCQVRGQCLAAAILERPRIGIHAGLDRNAIRRIADSPAEDIRAVVTAAVEASTPRATPAEEIYAVYGAPIDTTTDEECAA